MTTNSFRLDYIVISVLKDIIDTLNTFIELVVCKFLTKILDFFLVNNLTSLCVNESILYMPCSHILNCIWKQTTHLQTFILPVEFAESFLKARRESLVSFNFSTDIV